MNCYNDLFEDAMDTNVFVSTKPQSSSENRKARYKNHNLPILRHMYMGDPDRELECMINGTSGFQEFPCIVQKRPLLRFRIEFNHIRQRAAEGRQAGASMDKNPLYAPSELWRSRELDCPQRQCDLVEFMTMMPVDADAHKWITQSSAYGDITLVDFPQQYWPWHLQSQSTFSQFTACYGLESLDYQDFIDHLSSNTQPPIRERLRITAGALTLR
jgi:hypothetical protein